VNARPRPTVTDIAASPTRTVTLANIPGGRLALLVGRMGAHQQRGACPGRPRASSELDLTFGRPGPESIGRLRSICLPPPHAQLAMCARGHGGEVGAGWGRAHAARPAAMPAETYCPLLHLEDAARASERGGDGLSGMTLDTALKGPACRPPRLTAWPRGYPGLDFRRYFWSKVGPWRA